MRNYEITFIVDPVLSSDEIASTAKAYEALLKEQGAKITHVDDMGLRPLAYPIQKRTSGVYYCIEFQTETGELIPKTELSMTRDGRVIRFLTVHLDKYGVQYNQDKRDGKIGVRRKQEEAEAAAKAEAEAAAKKAAAKSEEE